MRFHSLQFRIRGSAESICSSDCQELDIADEFSHLAQSLGFEGNSDAYAGLWATQFVYNDDSLLEGDFLARGLCLDLLCDSNYPIPFGAIFLCLGETLKQTAKCIITELTVVWEPYSVRTKMPKGKSRGSIQRFIELKRKMNPSPVTQFSTVRYSCNDKRNTVLAFGTMPFITPTHYLPELALPLAAICSQWGEEALRHAETIQITAD